jgi:gliding motility-associated-like protein
MKNLIFRSLFLTAVVTTFFFQTANAQLETSSFASGWNNAPVFIENKGQFPVTGIKDPNILYAYDNGQELIYFRRDGFQYTIMSKTAKNEEVKDERVNNDKEWAEHEKEECAAIFKRDDVFMNWENSSNNVTVSAEGMVNDYYNYAVQDDAQHQHSIDNIRAYTKLIYKNLYSNIDVEFVFHENGGIKYSIIVHPGGDISQVKMLYNGMDKLSADEVGNIHIKTMFGDIVDEAPTTFYQDDRSSIITSSFAKDGKEISFSLGDYNHSKTIVIDPWQLTSGLGFGNSNKVWECEHDFAGNSYFWGGDTPVRLKKFNNAGTIQWTYNSPWDTANFWIGTFVTDNAGNSYCTGGSNGEIAKVNTAGAQQWYNNPNGFFGPIFEYWHIAFNCDQTSLLIGGMRASNPLSTNTFRGVTITINMGSGAVTGYTTVGYIAGFNIKEVRTICSSPSGNFYFLTLDSIGCVNSTNVLQWKSVSGYAFSYGNPSYAIQGNMGMSAIRATNSFIYTSNGNTIDKRNINTGAIITSAAIPGGINVNGFGGHTYGNSGLDIDSCGNVYVGSVNQIVKYDANLAQLSTQATPGVVYDVSVSRATGQVVACGNGFEGTYNMGACNPVQAVCVVSSLSASSSHTNILCNGSCTGTATAIPSGGTGPYTYLWSPGGQTTATINALCAGSYTCTVTDNVGATTTTSVTITQPTAITATQSQANISCNGGSNGSATVVASGGTPGYTYLWSPSGGTAATANGLGVGSYTCTITDANGCVITKTFSITQPTAVAATQSQVNISCNGGSNGSATVVASGGTPGYTYLWSPSGGTAATANGLSVGSYTCTITDANGCVITKTFTITQPTAVTVTPSQTNISCNGGSNGSATVVVSGGTPGYTYSWSPSGGTAATANGLTNGNYTCTITDANGCATTQTFSITQPTAVTVTPSQTNISCNGGSNGSATVVASGGTPGYTYSWSPSGGTAATASGLTNGNYTCTITDANGCAITQTFSITQPTAVSGTTSTTPTGCSASTGSATVVASGGTGAYTYSWAPSGGTGATANNLGVGNYTVTITDANGCTGTANASISSAGGPTVSLQSSSDATCFGSSNGSATVTATGNGPFTYSWTPVGGNAATGTNLPAGSYTCTIVDVNGCASTQTASITEPSALNASATSTPAGCSTSTGSATASVSGGTAGYTYLWAPSGGTGATENNLAAGSYTVTITDANGCTTTATTIVTSSGGPVTSVQSSGDVSCFGGANGTATINATGNGPFTYLWSPSGGTSATASGLSAQTYSVTVTDAGGCVTIQTVTITEPTALAPTTSSNPASCGNNNGDATVNVTGGTGPYTYLWNNSQTTATDTALAGGTYNVTVTDANGCTTTATVTVTNTGAPTVTLQSSSNISCFGGSDGSATVNATGGQSPYTYAWSPTGGTNASAQGLAAGTYTVTVTGADGCAQTQTVTLTAPTAIQVTNTVTPENCGAGDGSVSASVSGGTPGYTYVWSTSATISSINNLSAGTYSVTVTDANGCTTTQISTVGSSGSATANAGTSVTITSGQSTQLNGSGGGTYSWSPSGSLNCATCQNPNASPTVTTTYTLTVTDSLGCTATDTVTVFVDISCGTVYLPNAFSPNGDHENDVLYVRGNCIEFLDFEVYNRWGEKVFVTTDPNIGWDGTWRDKPCEAAVFTYFLRATLLSGEVVEKQGNISLVK